ncbi:MAG TPA: hypothetical protein VL595_26115 [Pseudonocardia sp.]|nr:hypothetical protein [Pseudonocardia sp.]
MTEPTREPESQVVPAGSEPDAHAHGPDTERSGPGDLFPAAQPLPYIKRARSRRTYDLLLLVPFICVGTSVGTLATSGGIFRHLGLVVAFGVLFAWIRAGLAVEKAVHTRWLFVMGGLVVAFLACGYLSKIA